MILSETYDFKGILKWLGIAVLMLVALKFSFGYAAPIMSVAAVVALIRRRPVEVLFWILFMTMTSVGNRAVFSTRFITVFFVRLTLMGFVVLVFDKIVTPRGSLLHRPFWGIFLYLAWEAVVSIQGYDQIVSHLKLILFVCVFLALYGVANGVNFVKSVKEEKLRAAILAIVALMVLGSVALIPFPGIGMMAPNEELLQKMVAGEVTSLFQGMCSHSQALGPLMGVIGTFIFADLVFSVKKWDPLYLLLLLSCPVLIYKTSSRTGMGTFVAGVLMVAFMLVQARGLGARWKGKIISSVLVFLVVCTIVAMAIPNLRAKIIRFALKQHQADKSAVVSVQNVFSSRQRLIDISLYNFRQKPITGNGFQVSEEMRYTSRPTLLSYFSAPIEKGVWMYAVLEEGGVIGFALFVGWLIVLFPVLYARKAYVMAATFFAFMVSNVGEFCLFSMTYMGGFYWMLVFAAGSLDWKRRRR